MCTSTPCSANCSRAAARMRLRLRRASARFAGGGDAGSFHVTGMAMSFSRLADRLLCECPCDHRHTTGIAIPYSGRSETGIHVPIIGPARDEREIMMTTAQEFARRRWIALALLCFAQFIVVLDASIVNVALPTIGKGLDFSQSNLPWVVNAYVLTFGGFLLLGGRLADPLGRRRLFIVGLVLFAGASFAGGIAPSARWAVAGRGG